MRIVMSKRFGCAASVIVAASLFAGLACPLPARAQAESSTHSTTFDNWVMTCTTRTDKDNKTVRGCEVRTTILIQDEQSKQTGVAAVVAIGQNAGSSTMMAAAQVPLAAALRVPVKLVGADAAKPIIELTYSACQPQGCQATATVTPAQLTALKGVGEKLSVVYGNLAGQTVNLNTNAKGLVDALNALGKEGLADNKPANAATAHAKK
jgi:invasion protein IalB